jgi:hypothetical protein
MIETPPPAVITCPVLDCGWTCDASTPDPRSRQRETLADVFGPGVYAAAAATQEAVRLERVLHEHFATHSTADYVRTMTHQREELERLTESLVRQTRAAADMRAALSELGEALAMRPLSTDDLATWVRSARAQAMRLSHGRSAASGRGWAQ